MHSLRIALAAAVIAVCGAAGIAAASPVVTSNVIAVATPMPLSTWQRGGTSSDRNLRRVYRGVERVIDNLQRDNKDYNGHRVAAINDLRQAREALKDALQFDRSKELPTPPPYRTQSTSANPNNVPNRSDRNLRKMIRVLERDVDMLQHDQHDYNGNRVKAINYIQQGRDELKAALLADQGH